MPYDVDKVTKRTLEGIAKAQYDYAAYSGGYWLWQASEYMATVYIAREISRIKGRNLYLTLENNVREAIAEAGGMGQGRPFSTLESSRSRFDILLWDGYTPEGMIEVKIRPHGYSSVEKDIKRMCDTMKKNDNFCFGLMACYYSFGEGERKLAKDRVRDRTNKIESQVRDFVGDEFAFASRRRKITLEDGGAWTASVMTISRLG